jgi:NADH-quinone oxidoreductase subunit M
VTLANQGTEPLVVSRVSIRGDEDDVRSPSRLTVHFAEGGGTSASIPPGASRAVIVAWMPERNPRVRQAFGHVVVTSADERAGEVAVGFRAQMPTGFGWIGDHALSLIVLLPLLMIPVAWAGPLLGPGVGRFVPCASIALATMRLLLALWACHKVSPIVTRADGNDGFQLIERTVWIRSTGSEWYLGVDGISVTLVVLVAALGLVAALVALTEDRGGVHHAGLAILASALAASLLALDVGLLFAAWSIAIAALVALVGSGGGPRAAQAAAKTGAVGALGAAALLVAFAALATASEPAYLVDGTSVAHTTAIPELARTSFAAKPAFAGIPFVEGVWVLLLVAAASVAPAVPLHQWLPDALEQGPASAGILAAGGLAALGPFAIVRVGLGAVPEGAQWLGPTIAMVGVGAAGWGSLCALAQRSLRRFVAYATVAAGGACLVGVGTLTPQGLAGAVAGVFGHGLASAMLLGAASALERRARISELPRLGGLPGDAPVLFAGLVVGLAVSAALPCTVAGWGLVLALLGSFTEHPGLGGLLVAAALVGLAAHGRVARALLFGPPDAELRGTGLLASLGGRFPDATTAEVLAVVPLAAVAVLLGLWPAPLLSMISPAAHDASAAVPTATPD